MGRLQALRPAAGSGPLTWDLWESAAGERLLLAELQLALGDPAGAIATAAAFDSPRSQIHLLYLARSLQVRSKAAAKLGFAAQRAGYQERLRSLGRTDLQ